MSGATVRSRRRGVLGDPLVGWGLAVVAVFVLHARVAPPDPTDRRIVVSSAARERLRDEATRRTGRAPTPAEADALVARLVEDEVLYREGLALGLDRGDPIVRRRLRQKLEMLAEGAVVREPTEAELTAYLATHAARWAMPARVTLEHVFASRERHGDRSAATAGALREALVGGADPRTLGDPFLRGRAFTSVSRDELAGAFGTGFAEAVFPLPVGQWSAPIPSSYGHHVVRVTARVEGRPAVLDDVRNGVRGAWLEERRAAARRDLLAGLRGRWQVRVEGVE